MAYIVHLRLPFQFLLSPIFLWGYLLGTGKLNSQLLIAYLSFHLFGYAGGTALNSYYDRDEGPIGGLYSPPPVPTHLLLFSLLWQAIGLALTIIVGVQFALIYVLMFFLSIAYSHPRTRWKAKPLLALGTVALGQGVLAFLGGWTAARGNLASGIDSISVLGIAAATLLTVGLYPLTQCYQFEEDERRGDLTFARFLGTGGSFRWATICVTLGGLGLGWILAERFSTIEAFVVLVFVALLIAFIRLWASSFANSSVRRNYLMLMTLYAATSVPFMGWISFHLLSN